MHSHPDHSLCFDPNCQMKTHQEIQRIYQAKASQIDLFDRLLMEKKQQRWADAQSTAKIQQIQIESTLHQVQQGRQHHGCKCSKIGCLKLYCQCFANGRKCNGNCICSCCRNKQGNEAQIYQAKMMANLRHPNHFKGIPAMTPIRKCTCKKSQCRKKYCQCYNSGLQCTQYCECKDCENGHPHTHNHRQRQSLTPFNFSMEIECQA